MKPVFGVVLCIGCDEAPSPPERARTTRPIDSAVIAPDLDTAGRRRAAVGVVFDPAIARQGDAIATLILERIDAAVALPDSTWVGTATFAGEIELSGETIPHHAHPEVRATCFEADSASAARMPRWRGDRRRSWFCLVNSEHAARVLAPPGVIRRATIVVDSFTIQRGMSDEVNTSRLVRVMERD